MVFETLISMPNVATDIWRYFGVHIFKGRLTVEDMERLAAAGDAWRRKNPGDCVEMVIVFPSENRMTNEERTKIVALIRRWEHKRRASATVILASGLSGAAARSVLTGFQLIAPPPHPTKVFGATKDALSWLLPHIESVCGPAKKADLYASVEDLCAPFRVEPGQNGPKLREWKS